MKKEETIIEPKSSIEWRNWLEQNHDSGKMIWVICSKKNALNPTMSHDEGVDEALCFGWIDGTARSLDSDRYIQSFTKRKPKSVWSKISKQKVAMLIENGKMTQAGLDVIKVAKDNGYWSILDEVEEDIVPDDLMLELKTGGGEAFFMALSRSDRKRVLQHIVLAQRAETRSSRIKETAEAAKQGIKPKPL